MESSDLLERPSKGGGQHNKGTTLPCGEHMILLGCNAGGTFVPTAVQEGVSWTRIGVHS